MWTARHPGKACDRHRFDELSSVCFRRAIKHGSRSIPFGSKAAVVAAYTNGIGYEVEVFAPLHAVVTVEVDDLTG